MFLAIGVFPMRYRSIWKFGGNIMHSKNPNLPPEVRSIMLKLAQEQYKEQWRPGLECVESGLSAPDFPPELLERFKQEDWWEPFHNVCPNPKDGFALLAAYHFSVKDFYAALKNSIYRIWSKNKEKTSH